MRIVNLPSAQADLVRGAAYYDEKQDGLGNYFLRCVFSDIDTLRQLAGMHRQVFGFHRLLCKRFPYAVYYSVDHKTAFVWAILDCRQDPEQIRKKLRALDH
jgi:hypothetical protein